MERLILDTTVLIDAERSNVVLSQAMHEDDDVAIAAVSIAELLVGIELSSGRRREQRGAFMEELLATVSVEDYSLPTARAHADLLVAVRKDGRPRGAHDMVIAATARASDRTVVTADADGFADLPGVRVRAFGS